VAADLRDIAISANGDPARFAAFGRPVLADGPHRGEGPLAGILAGLDWAAGLGCSALLSVPGDTPFIPNGLTMSLLPAPSCVVCAGKTHHLIALWPISAREALRTLLSSRASRRVGHFSAIIGMQYVHFAAGQTDLFTNLNTRDELAAARRLVEDDDGAYGGDRRIGGGRPPAGAGA
jgi:molybdopterin-guanine dinucleotide biosynthesis protein A